MTQQITYNQMIAKEKELTKEIATVLWNEYNLTFSDNHNVNDQYVSVDFIFERSGEEWHKYYNGKIRVYVGASKKARFHMKKDGVIDVNGIAAALKKEYESRQIARSKEDKLNALKDRNRALLSNIAQSYGLETYETGLDVDYRTGELIFKVTGISEEEAHIFLKLKLELESEKEIG